MLIVNNNTTEVDYTPQTRSMIFLNTPYSFPDDDETYIDPYHNFPSPSITYRRPMEELYLPPMIEPPVYTRMIENRPYVYQRAYSPDYNERSPYEFDRLVRASSPKKRSVYLPRHSKKLVQRFLNDLEHAHDYQTDDIDGCEICRDLRSSMEARRYRSASDGCFHRGHCCPIHSNPLRDHTHGRCSFRSYHNTIIKPTQSEVSSYPTGYTTFVDPKSGLVYAYDPNWQYTSSDTQLRHHHHGMSHTPIPLVKNSSVRVMDKATYTRMTSEKKSPRPKNTTVVVHAPRNPTPRTPKVIIEQAPRQYRRKPRRYRSTTIIKEHVPHTKATTYIRK